MKWNKHAMELIKKIKYFSFLFYKLAYLLQPNALKSIYHGLFESIINYGITAWGGAYNNSLKPIISLQNRLIIKINTTNKLVTPLNIKQAFITNSITYYFSECKKLFAERLSNTRTRQLILPKINKSISSKNAYYVAIKFYNKLPFNLKNLNIKPKCIRKKISLWILENSI